MIAFLRFIELVNAAVWLGGSLFFTILIAPGVFSGEMRNLLQHPFYPGAVAQVLFARLFLLQYCCAGIAIVLYGWECIRGRKFERVTFGLLISLLAIALVGGFWLQPKLKELHQIHYSTKATPAEQEAAYKVFGPLHGASQVVNLFVLGALLFYFWKLTSPARPTVARNPSPWG